MCGTSLWLLPHELPFFLLFIGKRTKQYGSVLRNSNLKKDFFYLCCIPIHKTASGAGKRNVCRWFTFSVYLLIWKLCFILSYPLKTTTTTRFEKCSSFKKHAVIQFKHAVMTIKKGFWTDRNVCIKKTEIRHIALGVNNSWYSTTSRP